MIRATGKLKKHSRWKNTQQHNSKGRFLEQWTLSYRNSACQEYDHCKHTKLSCFAAAHAAVYLCMSNSQQPQLASLWISKQQMMVSDMGYIVCSTDTFREKNKQKNPLTIPRREIYNKHPVLNRFIKLY